MRARRVQWAGDRSLLLEFDSLEAAMSAHGHLIEHPLSGQLDAISGARTVLLRMSGHTLAARAQHSLADMDFARRDARTANEIVIDVAYDGPDLADAAEFLGMSTEALIEWHSSRTWMGAFPGFAGFTYCVAPGEQFQMPRRTSPRTAVPGGSVALAGEFSGVYPRLAPGGWQLIGRTDAEMWSLDRESPALVQPWDTVTYRPVRPAAIAAPTATAATTAAAAAAGGSNALSEHAEGLATFEVLGTGLQTLIEDLGREGTAALGAGPAGAMDRAAVREANHAVGNAAGAPILEVLFGGLRMRALRPSVVAVTGAEVEISISGDGDGVAATGASDATGVTARTVRLGDPAVLLPGETISIGAPSSGARSVVAVRGGINAPTALGSASTDTHIKVGPPPVAVGDVLRVGSAQVAAVAPPAPHRTAPSVTDAEGSVVLRVVFGPRDDWFSQAEQQRFLRQRWIVTPASNRIGIRLDVDPQNADARPLERAREGELLSEGMALGSVQIPPSGTPVLLVNDQGITGGYPIIAVVLASDLPRAAQLAPGDAVRFSAVSADTLTPLAEPEGQDS
ncbi:5-oxoprolinase subunit B/C family protein [Leucobacter sp. GX24907]